MQWRRTIAFALALGAFGCRGTEPFVPVPSAIDIPVDAVSFGTLGRVVALTAVVKDQNGDPIAAPSVQWSAANGSVASVDGTGHVTALGVGATKVFASTQGAGTAVIRDSVAVTVAQVAAQLVKVAGDQQVDTTSGTLPQPAIVEVDDSLGHAVPGVTVDFTVTQGGGSVTPSAGATDAQGRMEVVWTLGSTAGANAISATATGDGIGGNPAGFTATAVAPGSLATLAVFAGDGQTGLVGYAVNQPPAVVLLAAGGAPVAGKTVTFTVTGGGGTVQGGTALTDANGVAAVGSWSLMEGANALTATVQNAGQVIGNPVGFTATGAVAAYHIDVRFPVPTTASRQAVFTSAASRWETLIFGDVPDVPVKLRANACASGQPAIDETVDDIIIYAILDSIDGPGKILGQAGPCVFRQASDLPVVGVMMFDTADVAGLESTGQFAVVIEHEMGHVLGLGTIWGTLLVDPASAANPGADDPHFVGAQALAAFDRSGGLNYTASAKVPVEDCVGFPANTCGAGSINSHWRESVFNNELMTGFIDAGTNPLSVVTTAAMGDVGYVVNYAASDSYTLPMAAIAAAPTAPGAKLFLGNDILRMPKVVVDRAGRIVQTIPPR